MSRALYIDRGKKFKDENKRVFEIIHEHKLDIEKIFSYELEWLRYEEWQASIIRKRFNSGGYRTDEELWPQIHEEMVETMIRFEKALSPNINPQTLNLES